MLSSGRPKQQPTADSRGGGAGKGRQSLKTSSLVLLSCGAVVPELYFLLRLVVRLFMDRDISLISSDGFN